MSSKTTILLWLCLLCLFPTMSKAQILEYWFDDLYDFRVSTSIASTESVQEFDLDLSDDTRFPKGCHQLNMRFTIDNQPSAVYSTSILKLSAGTISKLEYWLDDDISHSKTISGRTSDSGTFYQFLDLFDLTDATPGYHRLYCRAVSNDNLISSSVTMTPILVKSKYAGIDPANVKVTRYTIAVDDEEPTELTLPYPAQEVDIDKQYDVRDLTKGNHELKLQISNSAGLGVSLNSTFTVKEQETPAINLTAEESNGLVNIKFNSVPNDIVYRIYRIDANGAKAAFKPGTGGDFYPNDVSFTDNPPAGTYRYYVKCKYEDADGNTPKINSNEVSVTVTSESTETEYNSISGEVRYDDVDGFTKKRNVIFSDGVTVQTDLLGRFYRKDVPVGTHLTVTVEAEKGYTFSTEEFTVRDDYNQVYIKAEKTEEFRSYNTEHPLQFASYVEVVPGEYYRFTVKNVSRRGWYGSISVKALLKDYVNNMPIEVSSPTNSQVLAGSMASFTARQNYNCVYSDKVYIAPGETEEINLSERFFVWEGAQEYYIYFECNDESGTQLIEPNPDYNIEKNPLIRLIDESEAIKAENQKFEEEVNFAVNLIIHMLSSVKEIDGKLGDFDEYLKVFKECVGYDLEYIDYDYLSRKIEHVASYDELFYFDELWHFNTIVYTEADHFDKGISKFRDKVASLVRESKDILAFIKSVKQVIDYAKAYNEWQGMDDTERMVYFSERVLDFAASYSGPFVNLFKTYLDLTRISIANAKLLGNTYHKGFDAIYFSSENHLSDSERVGVYKHNRYIDFRIHVKKDIPWWPIDGYFDAEDVKEQIYDVTVTAKNTMGGRGEFKVEAKFTPVADGDYVYLRQIGTSGALSLGDGIEDMWMNIRWKNGRTTRVPLRHGSEVKGDGVKYRSLPIPFLYTITFQSGTSEEEYIADIIQLDD